MDFSFVGKSTKAIVAEFPGADFEEAKERLQERRAASAETALAGAFVAACIGQPYAGWLGLCYLTSVSIREAITDGKSPEKDRRVVIAAAKAMQRARKCALPTPV